MTKRSLFRPTEPLARHNANVTAAQTAPKPIATAGDGPNATIVTARPIARERLTTAQTPASASSAAILTPLRSDAGQDHGKSR